VIDLRSDTLTQPTAEMRRAIANAVVGDEQKREDPTVAALEERAADLLGQEEAVFLPTATMANQIALSPSRATRSSPRRWRTSSATSWEARPCTRASP
jgi:threonine aldolase